MHQHEGLIALQQPITPSLKGFFALSSRITAIEDGNIVDLKLLMGFSDCPLIGLFPPTVPISPEETRDLPIEQVYCPAGGPKWWVSLQRQPISLEVCQYVHYFHTFEPRSTRFKEEAANMLRLLAHRSAV